MLYERSSRLASLLGKAYFLNGSRNYSHIYGSSTVNLMHKLDIWAVRPVYIQIEASSFPSCVPLEAAFGIWASHGSHSHTCVRIQQWQQIRTAESSETLFESSSCCLGVCNVFYASCILTLRDKNFCRMLSFSGDSCVKRYQGACVCELIFFGN
jgi:hypothetical protein